MRIFITGGSGFLGSNVVRVAAERFGAEVVATHHRSPPAATLPGRWVEADMLDGPRLRSQVQEAEPDAVVHTAILNDFPLMYRDRRLAWDAYVGATRTVVEAANRTGAKVVLVSTDWVFDGRQDGANEETPPNPINLYGVLKLVCETVVQETARDGAVAGVAGVNGVHWARPEAPFDQNAGFGYFVNALLDRLEAGRSFAVWEAQHINMVGTPSLASDCAEMIVRILAQDRRGTFHCVGGESASRRKLAEATVEVFGLDGELLVSGPPELCNEEARIPFPHDTRLSAERTFARLDYEPPRLRGWLERMRDQRTSGRI